MVEDALGLVPVALQTTFDIPDNTLGFTLVARAPSSSQYVGFY